MRVVKSTEEFVAPCDWTPGAEKLLYKMERFSYEPEDRELPPPAEILKRCAPIAAECIRAAVEKGGDARVVMEACTEKIAEMIARSIAYRVPALKNTGGPGLHDEPGADLSHLDREPIEESAHEQPGADPLPHLDGARARELARRNSPVVIDAGPSKSMGDVLKDLGWETVEAPDEFEHYVHRDVGEVIVNGETFALRKNWDGEVVGGESLADLEDALASAE